MSASVLPFLIPGFAIASLRTVDMTLVVEAHSAQAQVSCPACQQPSLRVHSHYCRTARDLPVSEHSVRLLLHVRRFFCDNETCTRRTFTEPLSNLLPFRAQRT